jgi:hypothetical protein
MMRKDDDSPSWDQLQPLALLRKSMKAVPAVKFAYGLVGIAVAIALIRRFAGDFHEAVSAILAMVFLMVLLLVFSKLCTMGPSIFRGPALVLAWTCVIAVALLFSCIFFDRPKSFQNVKSMFFQSEPFTQVVQVYGGTDRTHLIPSGKVSLLLKDSQAFTESIQTDGRAYFRQIPINLRGSAATVTPMVEGYEQHPRDVKIDGTDIFLRLERVRISLRGRVISRIPEGSVVKVSIEEGGEGLVGRDGEFVFETRAEEGEKVRLQVFMDNKLKCNRFIVLRANDRPLEIAIQKGC